MPNDWRGAGRLRSTVVKCGECRSRVLPAISGSVSGGEGFGEAEESAEGDEFGAA